MTFNEAQINRYARHILLKEVGGEGQAKLLAAKVLVIGAGGLGSPLLLYLAAAGVGTIGVIDSDLVEISNLQRQIIHKTDDIGRAKVESAANAINAINPDVQVISYHERLTAANAMAILSSYDIAADGSDNFATRFLASDACYLANRTLVSAAILRFDGQLAVFKAHLRDELGGHGPCYRCLFPEPPPPGQIPTCAQAGVFGALCGVLGALQAMEVLKELLQLGESLSGHLIIYGGLSADFRKIKVKPDPKCRLCGEKPSIKDLTLHA